MLRRRVNRLGAAAALAALFLGVSTLPAGAAGAPSWQIAKMVPAVAQEFWVSASSPANAWATGDLKLSQGTKLGVERWNGRAWQPIAAPSSLGFLDLFNPITPVGSSSGQNAWVFPQAWRGSTLRSFALHWHDGRWTTIELPQNAAIVGTAVFSANDAWAFGSIGTGSHSAPYNLRWNGHKWRTVVLPGAVTAVNAISADNMWAIGTSTATLNQPANRQTTLAMHWNGKAWSSVPAPVPHLPRGGGLDADLAATSGTGLWFAYINFDASGGFLSNGLLRWDGRHWHRLRMPAHFTYFLNAAVQDGHGGLWVCSPSQIYHYSAGHWTQQPTPKGQFSCNALAWIPGTKAALAAGSMWTANESDGVILRSPGQALEPRDKAVCSVGWGRPPPHR